MQRFLILSLTGLLAACRPEAPTEEATPPDFTVLTEVDQILEYENLRLYPIRGDADFIQGQQRTTTWKTLEEGLRISRFRLTEKKPFGRREDRGAINTLTAQNKSQDTIIMIAGDVVRGGRQDRIIAADRVIPPRTITDIPVFCIEKGRWAYRSETDTSALMSSEKMMTEQAFTEFYSVASSELRRTIRSGDQEAVWDEVEKLCSRFEVETTTQGYADLETSTAYTAQRDAYLEFFNAKLNDRSDLIGWVAVSGKRILGTDILGHPDLLRTHRRALLEGYITDVITTGEPPQITDQMLERHLEGVAENYHDGKGRFDFAGVMVHFMQL